MGNLAISASVFRNDDGGKGDMQQANWSNPGWPTLTYRTNSDGDACSTDSRESYNALSCYESIFRDGFTEFCRLEYDAGLYPHTK
ncbi:hypothetical protein ACLBOM_07015 [Escherichia coli]